MLDMDKQLAANRRYADSSDIRHQFCSDLYENIFMIKYNASYHTLDAFSKPVNWENPGT